MIDSELGMAARISYDERSDDEDDDEVPFLNVGRERFTSDRRQIGGLMLVLGTCATFQPLTTISSLTGVDDGSGTSTTALSTLEIVTLASSVLQFLFGTLAMVVGYLSLVHDYGDYRLTGALIVFTQLAWMPFITGMVEVGQAASAPFQTDTRRTVTNGTVLLEEYVVNPFIPPDYLPTQGDVQFFGAMGILGIMAYGTGFLGSLAFTEFAQYAFDVGKPTHRDARYYRGRLLFYSFVLALAGVSQLLLGSYVLFQFGGGPLSPSVGVAMYRVYFPEISVAVGIVQLVVGYVGIARYLNYLPAGPTDDEMQAAAFLGWFLQLVLQYIVPISYGSGDENAAALPSLALLSLGLNLLPAYLDYKMRTAPFYLTNEYYGIFLKDAKDAHVRKESIFSRSGADDLVIPNSGDAEDQINFVNDAPEPPKEPSQNEAITSPSETEDEEKTYPLEMPLQYHRENKDEENEKNDIDIKDNANKQDDVTRDVDALFEQFQNVDEEEEDAIVVEEFVGRPPSDEEKANNKYDQGEDRDYEEGVVIIEEFVDFPDDLSKDYDDEDHDDRTPPQSNKSLESDTKRLSPLQEEDTERMLAEESDHDLNPIPHLSLNEEEMPDVTETDVDADSDEGTHNTSMAMSEGSTPSDDTAALEARINRLQAELISDTDMESYMNALM